jgi:hypothetical protein
MGSGAINPCYGSLYTNDASASYAVRVCNVLNAECHLTASSGIGKSIIGYIYVFIVYILYIYIEYIFITIPMTREDLTLYIHIYLN